jgi:hypothetical protein
MEQRIPQIGNEPEPRVREGKATVTTLIGAPAIAVPANKADSEEGFTEKTYEDTLDKVSRPVKGKYAYIPYSSEDFIWDKRREAELEDRKS